MSEEFKPHEMNVEMARIIAERMHAARKGKKWHGCRKAAYMNGVVAALMARVRINGVDWVNPPEVVGAPGVWGPEAVGDAQGEP